MGEFPDELLECLYCFSKVLGWVPMWGEFPDELNKCLYCFSEVLCWVPRWGSSLMSCLNVCIVSVRY